MRGGLNLRRLFSPVPALALETGLESYVPAELLAGGVRDKREAVEANANGDLEKWTGRQNSVPGRVGVEGNVDPSSTHTKQVMSRTHDGAAK